MIFFKRTMWTQCAMVVLACACAHAQALQAATTDYPQKPVRILVGVPPGSGADTVTRAVATRVTEQWGRSVIVDNRPGAGGAIAMETVARATADGYTLLSASVGLVATATALRKVPFDTNAAFDPVLRMTSQPYIVVVNPAVAIQSMQELIAYAKANPGALNYASSGTGSASHLGTELFKSMSGLNLVHVPYRGLAQAINEVAAGQVQVLFSTVVSAAAFLRMNRVRPIAVTTLKRLPAFPNLPTVAESGLPGYELNSSYGLYAPAGTPAAIIAAINREAGIALRAPEVRAKLAADGAEVAESNAPAEFRKSFGAEFERWGRLLKTTAIKVD
jgi:tripartite-type tricarboxylate transporter receptor subunit TctC